MQNKTDFDVVVAGAGPVGLFVACELALQGVSALVIEKQPQLTYDAWKDGPLGLRGLNMPSIELLYRRGLLPEVMPNAKGPTRLEDIRFFGHFAGLTIPADKVDVSRWKHILPGPSISGGGVRIGHLIKILTARALSLGATLLYSTPVTAYTSTSTSTVQITTPNKTYTASYLIAADGGRSTIRHLTPSLPFIGSEATWTGYAAHASLSHPTTPLHPGFNPTDTGMYITAPPHFSHPADKGGAYYILDFDTSFPRTETPTKAHLQAVLRRVSGVHDVLVDEVYTIGTFTDRAKQLSAYCFDGRVLFVGDAAHIHAPLGGQGLNLGLGDAMNLGWKVAAVVKGEAGGELLGTYGGERWEVGREVLEHTRAQTACLMPGEHGKGIRGLVANMSGTVDGATLLAEKFGGYDRRYDLGGDCWITGRSAPDFLFEDGRRLGQLLEAGKWLLIDFTTGHDLLPVAESLPCWVQYSKQKAEEMLGLTALLVRPDGVVAWASEVSPDAEKVKRALSGWMKVGEHSATRRA